MDVIYGSPLSCILVGVLTLLPLPHTHWPDCPLSRSRDPIHGPLSENYRVEERYEDHLIIKLILVSVQVHQLGMWQSDWLLILACFPSSNSISLARPLLGICATLCFGATLIQSLLSYQHRLGRGKDGGGWIYGFFMSNFFLVPPCLISSHTSCSIFSASFP